MNKKKALICYHHGLGDVIMLTPHLRYFYNRGFDVDLMCRKEVKTSHLLDSCPYVNKLIVIDNPWKSDNYVEAIINLYDLFNKTKIGYDYSGISTHFNNFNAHKIDITSLELGIELKDKQCEVFIDKNCENILRKSMKKDLLENGFIHVHTQISEHREHSWDASKWIKNNIHEDLPIIDTGFNGKYFMKWEDIRVTFELMKYAKYRVYSSSVMVHAADAMNLKIDVINYGKTDRKVWPLNQSIVKNIIENGTIIKGNLFDIKYFDVRHRRVINSAEKYEHIIEVGPGEGRTAFYMLNRGKKYSVIDNNAENLSKIKNKCMIENWKCELLFGNIEETECDENICDCVIACEVIEHIENYKQAVNNMIKMARYKVIITTPVGNSYYSPEHVHFFSEEDFEFINKKFTIDKMITKEKDLITGQRCFFIEINI